MARCIPLALVLLVALAGCDSADPAPSQFEAAFRGEVQKDVAGNYGYTLLSRYTGIGTGDGFAIQLRTLPSSSGYYVLFWNTPGAGDLVNLQFSEAAPPEGTFEIEGQPYASAAFFLNDQFYVVQAGTITVERRRGRLIGTFRFTRTYRSAEDGRPSDIQVKGRFDIALR